MQTSISLKWKPNLPHVHQEGFTCMPGWGFQIEPRSQVSMPPLQKKFCKASDKVVECEDCEKRFHASCAKLGDNELLKLEPGNGSWYCTNCKADCGLCSSAVLKDHKGVQCDSCEMWVHNGCSFITESQYETLENTNCSWICPKCDFLNFSDPFLMSS